MERVRGPRQARIGLVALAAGTFVLSGCGTGEATPQTTVSATTTTVGANPVSESPAPTTSVAATTAAPTTVPRTKADAEAEVIATIDAMNATFARCEEAPSDCDPNAEIGAYGSLYSPVVKGLAQTVLRMQEAGTYAPDATLVVRRLESIEISDDLNAATVTTCTVDPVLFVRDVDGEQEIADDDILSIRKTMTLVRLADASWVVGPSSIDSDVSAESIPLCWDAFERGESGTSLLPEDNNDPSTSDAPVSTGPSGSLPPQENPETAVLERLDDLNTDVGRCFGAPERCDLDSIVGSYSLPDHETISWPRTDLDQLRAEGWSYGGEPSIDRDVTVQQVSSSSARLLATVCSTDSTPLVTIQDDVTVPVDVSPAIAQVFYDWAQLANGEWVVIASEREVLNDAGELPPCFKP